MIHGYYYEFVDDIDERLQKVVDASVYTYGMQIQDLGSDEISALKTMLKAELVTQLPDLGGAPNYKDFIDDEDEAKELSVDELMKSMSVEQKVKQMIMVMVDSPGEGDLNLDGVGGYVLNGSCGETQTAAIKANKAKNNTQDASTITPFYSADDEGGDVNRFLSDYPPQRAYTGTSGKELDSEALKADFTKKAKELLECGVNLVLAPVADVSEDGTKALAQDKRSFGPDEATVTEAVKTAVQAFKEAGLASVIKHYPGYGSGQTNPHDEAQEGTKVIGPFKEGFNAAGGSSAIMLAHYWYDSSKTSATLSKSIVDELEKETSADALTMTDGMDMAIVGENADNKYVQSVDAGVKMVMPPRSEYEQAVQSIMDAIQDPETNNQVAGGELLGNFRITGYSAEGGDNITDDNNDPHGTSSGHKAKENRTVAVNVDTQAKYNIPEGSVLLVGDRNIPYVVEDKCGIPETIDIFFEKQADCYSVTDITYSTPVKVLRRGWGPEGKTDKDVSLSDFQTEEEPTKNEEKEKQAGISNDGKLYMSQIDKAVRAILTFKLNNNILTSTSATGAQDGYAIYPIQQYNTPEMRGRMINQVFGNYTYGGGHNGTDISFEGTGSDTPEIHCAFPGKVVEAGETGDGLGTHVTIEAEGNYNGQKVYFKYGHMSDLIVQKDQQVQAGQLLRTWWFNRY